MAAKEELVFRAKLAEQAERFEDMVGCMKEVAKLGGDLSVEERNLLSVAYKNVIGAKRASWRVISSIKTKNEKTGHVDLEKESLTKIEEELEQICNEVINLLDDHLIKKNSKGELVSSSEDGKTDSLVFYLKMKGDYHRYLAEIQNKDNLQADKALDAYDNAHKAADTLPNTHPIKLGLALNYSVFHYEIRNDAGKACELAKTAFDQAIAELDELKDETYKDSTLIMQLLRDNLTLWTAEGDGDDGTQVEDIEAGGE